MEKKRSGFFKWAFTALAGVIAVLLIIGHRYELSSRSVSIFLLFIIAFCTGVALLELFIIRSKLSKLFKIILIFVLSLNMICIIVMYQFSSVEITEHEVYSDNDRSVIFRVRHSIHGGRCSVYLRSNPFLTKKVDFDNTFAFPDDYDPVETGDYEIIEEVSRITLRIKIRDDSNEYREITIDI